MYVINVKLLIVGGLVLGSQLMIQSSVQIDTMTVVNQSDLVFEKENVKHDFQEILWSLPSALKMKKGEAQINTFSSLVTYLFQCNTDTTSLLSGTAIKATVAYITDYVTKPRLNTYSMFDTIRQIFE